VPYFAANAAASAFSAALQVFPAAVAAFAWLLADCLAVDETHFP